MIKMRKLSVLIFTLLSLSTANGGDNGIPVTLENDQVSLEFQYEGKTLEDNSSVVIEAKKDDWGFGGLNCETNPIKNPLNGLIVVTSKGGQNGTDHLHNYVESVILKS